MSTRPTGVPKLDRLGITPQRGAVPRRSIFANGSTRGAERPLFHQLIGEQTLRFYCRGITVAAPVCPTAGWYGIASWRIPDDIGEQAALVGYRVEMSSPDQSGADTELFAAGFSIAAWGNKEGGGGALVIGLNLPCQLGVMVNGPEVPGANTLAPGTSLISQASNAPKVFGFNQGDWGVAGTPMVHRVAQVTPLCLKLTQGSRLDVAVVMESQYVNGATATFGMKVYGELSLAQMLTRGNFAE